LDDLAPQGDGAREEVRRLLRRFLPKERPAPAPHSPAGAARATLRCDGASRGNPGPAAIGVVLTDASGATIESFGRPIGTATNNVAEYRAVSAGLEAARAHGLDALELRLDSELVVRQLNGQYKVRHPALADLKDDVDRLLAAFRSVRILHVPREENREADRLANEALDRAAEASRE
jgi:ribonuclease HI